MHVGTFVILGNALLLGIRHGFDWDHIAAISDIVGTAGATTVNVDGSVAFSPPRAIRLSSLYAVGHAAVVLVLGVLALQFAKILPEWIDPFMERAVGVTLLMLGAWIIYSISNQSNYGLKSRWMILCDWLRPRPSNRIQSGSDKMQDHGPSMSKLSTHGDEKTPSTGLGTHAPSINNLGTQLSMTGRSYTALTTFGVGAIHGIGAETGTQVLVIAAVGGATDIALGLAILCSFICGLLISNTMVALIACAGFFSSARFKPVLVTLSIITGIFSLAVGAVFLTGNGDLLPALGH